MIRVPDFDALYRDQGDPWRVGSSRYEQRKLDLVLACLAQPRYAAAWDPACGTGHLVRRLAERCDRVLATDGSTEAVALARRACAGLGTVVAKRHRLPEPLPADWPAGFDLVVLGEFLYYLADADRSATVELVSALAAPTAELLAVHWRHAPHDAWLSGAAVQAEVVARLTRSGWVHRTRHRDPDFGIDTLQRTGGLP